MRPEVAAVCPSAPLPASTTKSGPAAGMRAVGAGQPRSDRYVEDASWAAALTGAWFIVVPLVRQKQRRHHHHHQRPESSEGGQREGAGRADDIDWPAVQSVCAGYTVRCLLRHRGCSGCPRPFVPPSVCRGLGARLIVVGTPFSRCAACREAVFDVPEQVSSLLMTRNFRHVSTESCNWCQRGLGEQRGAPGSRFWQVCVGLGGFRF